MSILEIIRANKRKLKIAAIAISGCIVVIGITLFVIWNYYNPEKVFSTADSDRTPGLVDRNRKDTADSKALLIVNLVLLGFDKTEQVERFGREDLKGHRTARSDTIIFASIDMTNNTVKVVSIPRDTRVQIANTSIIEKINHAYSIGFHLRGENGIENDENMDTGSRDIDDERDVRYDRGLLTTLETISDFMEAAIDYYVSINIDDLIEIVDLMGGVYHDVEAEVRADLGLGRVLIEPGYKHLDGEHFFYYIHHRDVLARTDQERIARQQSILKSAFLQFKKMDKLTKIPSVFNKIVSSIETNLTSRHVGSLVRFLQQLDLEDIRFYSFEGEYEYCPEGIPYFIINDEQKAAVIDEMFKAAND